MDTTINMSSLEEGATANQIDLTVDEVKMIEALRILGIKPKIETEQDLTNIAASFTHPKTEHVTDYRYQVNSPMPLDSNPLGSGRPAPTSSSSNFPRLSLFYGQEGKGEVNWEAYRFEVESLIEEKTFTDTQILMGLRRSLKGNAADKIRRLGPGSSLNEVMKELENTYGSVESPDSIMTKFYTCSQKPGETVESFAARLEELFGQAVSLGVLRRSDKSILKGKLYGGLTLELKQTARPEYKGIEAYDDFKKELRKLELELIHGDTKPARAAPVVPPSQDMSDMKDLLLKLNNRIDQLERGQQELKSLRGFTPAQPNSFERGRGRGGYQAQRPLGGNTFVPTCYYCNEKGHLKRDCPSLPAERLCFHCHEPGHIKRNCPKV